MDEYSLPIDIHTNKLAGTCVSNETVLAQRLSLCDSKFSTDWLISRRHCSKNWTQKLADVRQKIKKALEDMPESDDIARILADSRKYQLTNRQYSHNFVELDYFSCEKIVEVLKKTESDSKNMFGYYSSQRMKDWQEILKLYEQDNLYLSKSIRYSNLITCV